MQRLVLLGTGVLLLLISATAFLGCGGGAGAAAVTINLSPTDVSLNRGATAQMTAQALTAGNVTVATPTLAYHSDNPAITVSNSGLICAGQWDANFITCYTCSNPDLITNQCPANNSALLPLATANITATATVNNVTVTSTTVVVTDHEPIDTLQLIPDPSNPIPGSNCNPTGCFTQGTPIACTPNTGMFTTRAFSNDPAACQRITGSANVPLPCQVPNSTIGSVNWAVSPATVATADATTKVATDPVVVTALVPGQGTVVGSVGAAGSLVSGSAPFTTCAVASIHVQKSASDNSTSFTAPVGSTVTLAPIVTDRQGVTLDLSTSTLGLTWLSSQPALASVSLGTVNTAAPGTAEITAACLPSACNVNLNQPVYSDNAVTAIITGTVDSTVLVTTATPPSCVAAAACSNSNLIIPIDTGTNNAGTAFTLPAGVQVNSMVLSPTGDPAFLGTICAYGATGPSGAACSGLLRFDPTVSTVASPSPSITGTVLTTDGNRVVVSDPTTNQLFILTGAGTAIEAIPAINISSLLTPTGATESGNTVTLTTTTPHGLIVGQLVLVAGVGVAGYNGVQQVVSTPSPTSFTYTVSAANTGLAPSGGGYVTGGVSAAISPDGSKVYIVTGQGVVTSGGSQQRPGGKLYIYNPSLPLQNRDLSPFGTGSPPPPATVDPTSSQAVSFFATGPMAYVADTAGDDIAASCDDMLFSGPLAVPGFPTHIAAVPNATAMVDANGSASSVDVIEVTPSSSTPFGFCPPHITNVLSSQSFASLGVSSFTSEQLIVTPDSNLAIVLTSDQGVLVYNLGTKQTSRITLTGSPVPQPISGGVTPDSAELYVGANDGKVHRIDLSTLTDAQSIAVSLCPSVTTGCNPDFLVVRPVATVATLSSLAVTPANPTIGVGATQQFTATGTFSDKTTRDMTNFVVWTSSNAIVAVVGPNTSVTPPITTPGLARALATGTATIEATSAGIAASTTLTVQ